MENIGKEKRNKKIVQEKGRGRRKTATNSPQIRVKTCKWVGRKNGAAVIHNGVWIRGEIWGFTQSI